MNNTVIESKDELSRMIGVLSLGTLVASVIYCFLTNITLHFSALLAVSGFVLGAIYLHQKQRMKSEAVYSLELMNNAFKLNGVVYTGSFSEGDEILSNPNAFRDELQFAIFGNKRVARKKCSADVVVYSGRSHEDRLSGERILSVLHDTFLNVRVSFMNNCCHSNCVDN